MLVVVVVGRNAENLLAGREQVVPDARVELVKSVGRKTAVVVKFNGEKAMKRQIIVYILHRPDGMIYLREKSRVNETVYHILYIFIGSDVLFVADMFLHTLEFFAYARRGVAGSYVLMRLFRVEIYVEAGTDMVIFRTVALYIVLGRYHREKVLVAEFGVVEQEVVIAVRDDAVTLFLIYFFKFRGGKFAVRPGAVAVKICLKMICGFGYVLFSHGVPLYNEVNVRFFCL